MNLLLGVGQARNLIDEREVLVVGWIQAKKQEVFPPVERLMSIA